MIVRMQSGALGLLLALPAGLAFAATAPIIGTVVGGRVGDLGPATQIALYQPNGIAVDSNGNMYIADTGYNRIRRVDPSGNVKTVAGNGVGGIFGDGSLATSSELYNPSAVAVDTHGNLFIADTQNLRIRKVDISGVISTIAGTGSYGFGGDGGLATAAKIGNTCGVAVDDLGNVFISDSPNNRIRKVDTNGVITTVAGNGTAGYSGDNGLATNASLNFPYRIALDANRNIYIADEGNNRIRKVDVNGIITTVAGTGTSGFSGDSGPATNAKLAYPQGVAVNSIGEIFIADWNNARIRKVASDGTITTIAGNGARGSSGDGGAATSAELNNTADVAIDANGNTYIADYLNNRIRKVDATSKITLFAGAGSGDGGPRILGELHSPSGMAFDADGNLFIADEEDHRVRKVDVNGNISTVAGTGTPGYAGDGGLATLAELDTPKGVAADAFGNLYIAIGHNASAIRKVDSVGNIITVAGGPFVFGYGGDGGPASNAQLKNTQGVAVDAGGNIYIADYGNNRVRRIDASTQTITTFAGNGIAGFSGDGGLATSASLHGPLAVAFDATGNLYIADSGNQRIRKVDLGNVITTVAGNGSIGHGGDGGPATSAALFNPTGVAVDPGNNIFIVDSQNARVRRVDSSGVISTVAGNGAIGYAGDGGAPASALLNGPVGAAVDPNGNLYIADAGNFRVRAILPGVTGVPVDGVAAAAWATGGGGSGCSFAGAQFTNGSDGATTSAGSFLLPLGMFEFSTTNTCAPGGTLTVTISYSQLLPENPALLKYGPTVSDSNDHWYSLPAIFGPNSVTYSITDGEFGDSDLVANGQILDPVAIGSLDTVFRSGFE